MREATTRCRQEVLPANARFRPITLSAPACPRPACAKVGTSCARSIDTMLSSKIGASSVTFAGQSRFALRANRFTAHANLSQWVPATVGKPPTTRTSSARTSRRSALRIGVFRAVVDTPDAFVAGGANVGPARLDASGSGWTGPDSTEGISE